MKRTGRVRSERHARSRTYTLAYSGAATRARRRNSLRVAGLVGIVAKVGLLQGCSSYLLDAKDRRICEPEVVAELQAAVDAIASSLPPPAFMQTIPTSAEYPACSGATFVRYPVDSPNESLWVTASVDQSPASGLAAREVPDRQHESKLGLRDDLSDAVTDSGDAAHVQAELARDARIDAEAVTCGVQKEQCVVHAAVGPYVLTIAVDRFASNGPTVPPFSVGVDLMHAVTESLVDSVTTTLEPTASDDSN